MTEQRKQEIIQQLQDIFGGFTPTQEESELTMYGLISRYNSGHQNLELIGGDWVIEICPAPLNNLL